MTPDSVFECQRGPVNSTPLPHPSSEVIKKINEIYGDQNVTFIDIAMADHLGFVWVQFSTDPLGEIQPLGSSQHWSELGFPPRLPP